MTTLLSIAVLVSALLHIRAESAGSKAQIYLFKPLTTILILMLACISVGHGPSLYKNLILIGLIFSLTGDIFLMLPKDRFIAGLASFLVAHLCYIAAFAHGVELQFDWRIILPLGIYSAVLLKILLPKLGDLKIPVLIYCGAILVMTWLAITRCLLSADPKALYAGLGAILFTISDSTLALDRFNGSFRSAQTLIMSTYFLAQWLIASSI